MNDVQVILWDLPLNIKGFTKSNPDTSYTIVLNARLSHEMRLHAYLHELQHIENGDLYRDDVPADQIESLRKVIN